MVRLLELAARRRLALTYLIAPLAVVPVVVLACYSTGNGTPPPPATFYFPVGMVVSQGGNVLYVVNSDFDLQWNGGTIQSYDLYGIRRDAAISAAGYSLSPQLPFPVGGGAREFLDGGTSQDAAARLCPAGPGLFLADGGLISPCAPYIDSSTYERDTVTIGAFATDLQLAHPSPTRLYAPVRGDASLTWLDITADVAGVHPDPKAVACDAAGGAASSCYAPFELKCGQANNGGRCDLTHHAGVNPNEPGNTRNLTMPGEPFAMAQTEDGTAIILTHQGEGDTSLFLTGFVADGGPSSPSTPSMQYIVDAGLPLGGDGIDLVPHDPAAYGCDVGAGCVGFPRPAFLETNNTAPSMNLIRYYSDDYTGFAADASTPDANVMIGQSLPRPFIEVERTVAITALSSGTDSRGIAFDRSARIACEATYPSPDPRHDECARLPARVFIANRQPPTLIVGTSGGPAPSDPMSYDADSLSLFGMLPSLDTGPSRVYVAPIIDADGDYALRVFVVCFDSNTLDVINPDTETVEARIPVGAGPFAMTFDPFDALEVAMGAHVQPMKSPEMVSFQPGGASGPTVQIPLPRYRFAYIASFTNSYVQVLDLDNSEPSKATFESIVYTLGTPSVPIGNQQ